MAVVDGVSNSPQLQQYLPFRGVSSSHEGQKVNGNSAPHSEHFMDFSFLYINYKPKNMK
jgi:hypothetical protein